MASLLSLYNTATMQEDPVENNHPLFTAATMHSIAAADDTPDWQLANMPKAIAAIGTSAFSGFYNTGVAVNNFFGGDAQVMDVAQTLALQFDDDYANYYRDNQGALDAAGFIAGALIPGLGASKVLSAGQKFLMSEAVINTARSGGVIGKGTELFTKLVVPNTARYVDEAKAAFSATNQAYSLTKKEATLAAMSGVHGAALEALTAETLILATMYKSPVLEDMSGGEIVKQMALGTLLGAGIGGVFAVAGQRGTINKALVEVDKELTAIRDIGSRTGLSDANSILHLKMVGKLKEEELARLGDSATEAQRKAFNSVTEEINTEQRRIWGEIADNQTTADVLHQMTKDMEFDHFAKQGLDALSWTTRVEDNAVYKLQQKLVAAARKKDVDLTVGSSAELDDLTKKLEDLGMRSFSTRTGQWIAPRNNFGLLQNRTREQIDGIVDNFKLSDVGKVGKPINLDDLSEAAVDTLYRKVERMSSGDLAKLGKIHATQLPLLEQFALRGMSAEVIMESGTKTLTAQELVELVIKPQKIAKTEYALNAGKTVKSTASEEGPVKPGKTRYDGYELKEDYVAYMQRHNLDRNAELGFHPADWSWASRQDELAKFQKDLDAKGLKLDARYVPEFITVGTRVTNPMAATEAEAMQYFMNTQKAYQDSMGMAVGTNLGEDTARLMPWSPELLASANRFGAGNGLLSNANGEYNTLASAAEFTGRQTELMIKRANERIEGDLAPSLQTLFRKPEATAELSAIDTTIARSSEQYVRVNAEQYKALRDLIGESPEKLSPNGGLVPRVLRNVLEADDPYKALQEISMQQGTRKLIPIVNKETADVIDNVMAQNSRRQEGFGKIAAVRGQGTRPTDSYYPMLRPSPKEQKFFHFIRNKNLTSADAGAVTMLRARTAEELDQLTAQVDSELFEVITNKGSADWHKAIGDYERGEAVTDMYFDVTAIRKGTSAGYHTPTDPQVIVGRIMEQQKRMETGYIRENVRAKYEVEFDTLDKLGYEAQVTNRAQFGVGEKAASRLPNPYESYKKTSLGYSTLDEHPVLDPINKGADKLFSQMIGRLEEYAGKGAKSEAEALEIEKMFSQYGFKLAAKDAMTQILADRQLPTGVLSEFVRNAHKFLAMTVLRLDWLNSVNNAIGTQVLLSAETNSALRKAASLKLPGVDATIGSTGKLIADAHKDYAAVLGGSNPELKQFFKANGFIPDVLEQQAAELASMQSVFKVGDNAGTLTKMAEFSSKWAEKATTLTGNKLSEEYSRFIAAAVGKRLADAQGLTDLALVSYINTFTNRVAGNVTASQRPLIFSGPVGSMMGLFQSYQFNMIQQLFRYLGEDGGKKAAAIAMGVQASMYGANGLPGFQLMNRTLLTGDERDAYQTTHEVLGKDVGNYLLYGAPSAFTGVATYTRGDLNPRYATILPNTVSDIPIINATTRVFGNLFNTASMLGNGADVSTAVLQGLEHNGLNRPLAGLAAVLQGGYSTSLKGNMKDAEAQDLLSISTLGRIAGGKPMDSSVANDAVFRIQSVDAKEKAKLDGLRLVVKSHYVGGRLPNEGDYNMLLEKYLEAGGTKKNWNKWMVDNYKQVNTSEAERIANELDNPRSRYMQELLRD